MDDEAPKPTTTAPALTDATVHLTASELKLVDAAVRLLIDTLGHEEADELEEAQAILRKLEADR